jgi:signal transduction histidine kinase
MNLRVRFAFWFAAFVAVILSVTFAVIYFQSAEFREEEFFERLEQKARTTQRLWFDVQEIDSSLLKIIDRNTLTALNQERVLIFDGHDRLIYTSADEDDFQYDTAFLRRIHREGEIRYTDPATNFESIGLLAGSPDRLNVVMATAYDLYGFRKLTNLRNILLITWLLGLAMTVVLSYLYVRNIVGQPLAGLTEQLAEIGEHDLTRRIRVPENQNELTTLAQNFNDLLRRLEQAFESQRGFVQYASHELRTPLANMLSETENTLSKDRSPETYRQTLQSLREEQSRLVELTNSLLLLSRYEKAHLSGHLPRLRVDEVLYNTIEEVQAMVPEYRITLDFTEIPANENCLLVQANEPLLRTAFRNLLENACRYAGDRAAFIHILGNPGRLEVFFDNRGEVLSDLERSRLFTPFFRGGNASGKRGYGLGLVIAQRILSIHGATIEYQHPEPDTNRFVVKFT